MIFLAAATAAYTLVVSYIVDQANAINTQTTPAPATSETPQQIAAQTSEQASPQNSAQTRNQTRNQTQAQALAQAQQYAKLVLPVLLGITLLSGLSNYAQRILSNKIALNTVGALQKDMFERAHAADFATFSQEPIGNLISKFTNDVTVLSNALIRALSNIIKDLLTVILTIAAMLYQNWPLTLMVLLLYPLCAWPIITISKRLRGNAKAVQKHIGKITSDLNESFSSARMIKTYGLETFEIKRLGQTFNERIRLFLKLVTEQARVDPILEVMGGLAIAGVVIFGVFQVTQGSASAGSIAGVLTGLLVLSPRIRALGTLNTVIQEGLSALERIYGVIDQRPRIIDTPNAHTLTAPKGQIEFKNVSFTYADGTQALDKVSFHANPGETLAFVGASGSGKSTLINLIPRLYEAQAGSILVDNHTIKDVTLSSLRASIALVSQSVTLFDDSVLANIGFGDQNASEADIILAAKAADAHDFIMALPQAYQTRLGENGDSLSGGQKQRLSIARAILRDAPILLLDEATSALDAESEAKVQAALEALSKGRTTLIVAHKLSTILHADRIYVIDSGQIKEQGSAKALLQNPKSLFSKLKKLQG